MRQALAAPDRATIVEGSFRLIFSHPRGITVSTAFPLLRRAQPDTFGASSFSTDAVRQQLGLL
jgi:hypothetical protein